MTGKRPSREAIAHKEIGITTISRPLAVMLTTVFLAAVFLVPLGQYILDHHQGVNRTFSLAAGEGGEPQNTLFARINTRNVTVLESIDQLETTLEEESFLRKFFLPPLQYVFLRFFHQGNEKAIPGRNGWLHYAPALQYLSGPPFLDAHSLFLRRGANELWESPVQPDPLPAIIAFKKQLEERGIKLVLVPVPVKAAIHPEKFSRRGLARPLANRSWHSFVAALEQHGVQLLDVRTVLSRYAENHGAAYLATDTHWTPGAMQAVAAELAEVLAKEIPGLTGSVEYATQLQQVLGLGDIARMLTLPSTLSLYPEQEVHIRQILSGQQEFWQADRNSEVLLLGDSFTNIFSRESLGWGLGGGFAEQLSFFLQMPVDLLARNDSGAYVTREMLGGELARGRDRLAGKKVVIWQFAERELALGDWRRVALQLGKPGGTDFYVAPSGAEIRVIGTVAAISRSPRPGAVPYRDNILTMHLVDLRGEDGLLPAEQALVYLWGMRDNRLTPFADLRPGDTVSLALTDWEAVEGEFGSYRRTPLDDQMLELELPNWGISTDDKRP